MPIYEFYCDKCHSIFSFLSRVVNTRKRPACPRCKKPELERVVSSFAAIGRAKEPGEGGGDLPEDDARMERAMETLAQEAESINDDDPRQAANLMRKLSQMTGMKLGGAMEEALNRMEAGEDPESIEADMGNRLNEEDPFEGAEAETGSRASRRPRRPPKRDPTLYEM